jgi:hypothetical protein
MVLVTVMALAMLLGPPRIGIFLAELSRFVGPTLRRLAVFDLCILISRAVLGWNRYERGINDLTAHRQVALFFQIAVKVLEQGIDHAALRKLIAVQPDRLGIQASVPISDIEKAQLDHRRRPKSCLLWCEDFIRRRMVEGN